MDELIDIYAAWCEEQGLPLVDAGEQMAGDFLAGMGFEGGRVLTPEQRTWLTEFERRWDRQQRILDRISDLCAAPLAWARS